MSTNIHIDPSVLSRQPRIDKITRSLAKNNVFDKIYYISLKEPGLSDLEVLDDNRIIIRVARWKAVQHHSNAMKAVSLIVWFAKVLFIILPMRVSCINCHRLPLLPFCVFIKLIKGSQLVYDAHELETETTTCVGWRRKYAKLTEKLFIRYVDQLVVVCNSIGKWYRKRYNIDNIWTVKNVPDVRFCKISQHNLNFRHTFNIPDKNIVFLYQGVISEHRGIQILLKVFSEIPPEKHIIFLGFGNLVGLVGRYAAHFPNIHFHRKVNQEDLLYLTSTADVGISLIENACLSYYFCLPNKVWEYLSAGIPLLVSNFPEMRKLVETYECGWTTMVDAKAIRDLVTSISRKDIEKKRIMVEQARNKFAWEIEEKVLLKLYANLGYPSGGDK